MSKKLKQLIITTSAVIGLGVSSLASAELAGNVGATSDYLWRGTTQTNHQAAISGGVDYSHSIGIYAGTWVSNVSFAGPDTEIDLYAGFATEVAGLGIDVGYLQYAYPSEGAATNFAEAYINLSYSIASFGYFMDFENKTSYMTAGLGYEVKEGLSIGAVFGQYSFDGGAGDYMHYGVSIDKSLSDMDVSFSISATDMESGLDKNPTATISFSKDFSMM
ncbi:MAG: TorF family putative porin [Gammaproteobacteria bacterium]|nr:TorF family putative porin [Gammaproteobacteria bacterium]